MIIVRKIFGSDAHGQPDADAVTAVPYAVKGTVSIIRGFGLGPVGNADLQNHVNRLFRADRKVKALDLGMVQHL